MTRIAFAVTLLIASTALAEADQAAWSPEQREVWAAVESRINAWTENNYEAYLAIHHDRWHRFSMVTSHLSSKEDVARFWKGMKENEKVLRIDLTPIAIDVYGNDTVGIAHYIAAETLEWTAATRRRPNGRLMEQGHVYEVPARFSDVYVKEGGQWLYVGGYRDWTCDILPESKNTCRE